MVWWLRVLPLAEDPNLVPNTYASWVTAINANLGGGCLIPLSGL